MPISSINPATGEVLQTFDALTGQQLEQKITRAAESFRMHRLISFADRAEKMMHAAEILESEKHELARTMTLEMGKPLNAAVQEAEKCAWVCRYYAENAARHLADEVIETNATKSYVRFQPLGAVLAVMPWNFPFWQVFRFAAPALMAGNVGLLKHASNVPACALEIERTIRRAGFPADVFQTLLIGSRQVERVIDDPRVKAVTLTGSEPAGMQVASQAGKQIKKTVLELGGSDPFIITPKADLDRAVRTAVEARCINNGQSCIAAKRFIVDTRIADEFERRFTAGMAGLKMGDPMDESVQVGPLSTPDMAEDLDKQVRCSVEMGARVLTGGARPNGPGNFYPPTVLTDVPKNSPAYREELFGPVAVVLKANGIDEAIRLANDTEFGLGASAWTSDEAEQKKFIDEIEAGMVFINGMVASDPRVPFGGVKRSGYGRELSAYGIREFVNVKTVRVA